VVVPAFNAPAYLERCLKALAASSVPFELILVDDASSDAAALELIARSGARVVRQEKNGGPAVARNAGARVATGELLVFIDSDVVVGPETLAQLARVFVDEPEVDACFGSYDAAPDAKSTVSSYRNLLHHYVHQTGPRDATTFWAGCGALRRAVFLDLGGYDERFARPSIEDIELGMRLREAGHRIRLAPWIQVKHLMRWRFAEMVRVDVNCRAIPWTRLLIERPGTGGDLNLARAQKLCVVAAFLSLGALPLALALGLLGHGWWWFLAAPACWLPIFWINRGFYALLARERGVSFLLAGVALHLLYYLYGGIGFLWAKLTHQPGRDVA
jgi:glycosyltransferase involved in cell wall biosynthesis